VRVVGPREETLGILLDLDEELRGAVTLRRR